MGFFSRLFSQPARNVAPAQQRVVGAGCTSTVTVVGTEYRLQAATRAVRQMGNREGLASLLPEPTNPHDPNAVRVVIGGIHVGYLSRFQAKKYKPALALVSEHGGRLTVRAVGTTRRGGSGQVDISLLLPNLKPLLQELEQVYATA